MCEGVCEACLCERTGAAEQRLSLLVCEAHRVPQGWVTACNQIRDNRASACLSLAPLPHPPGSALLVALSASTGLCKKLCLLASPVPTRCPLWSRGVSSQERGPLVCRDQLMRSPKCIRSRVSAPFPVTCFLMCWGPGMVLCFPPRICCDSVGNTFSLMPSLVSCWSWFP